MRIAFHPTLKAPDHPVPSGDREMARLLLAALQACGHIVELPSPLRSHAKKPDLQQLAALEQNSAAEAARLLQLWLGMPEKPGIWFTYHLYYKAPDLIGPAVAGALGIPYVVAEASHAPKRNLDAWASHQRHAEAALQQASTVFCLTRADRQGLEKLKLKAALVNLPPFIETSPFEDLPRRHRPSARKLVTIAMMRDDAKLQSYRFLAQALKLAPAGWQLTIAGDGPARGEVEAAFAGFPPGQVRFAGLVERRDIPAFLSAADIFVWPGFQEAYGLVYLEAQAAGLPVLALDCGGISSTMLPGQTGILVREPNPLDFAQALAHMLEDPDGSRSMGAAARAFVLGERNLADAAKILDHGLQRAREAFIHAC